MTLVRTDFSDLRESARRHKVEHAGAIAATNVQKALETLDSSIAEIETDILPASIEFVIDGGGQPILAGVQGSLQVPFAATITSATLVADQVGSIVIDIWKSTFAGYPPNAGNSITASAQPTLSSAQTFQDNVLSGWTIALNIGDWLVFDVVSATGALIKRCTLSLAVTRG